MKKNSNIQVRTVLWDLHVKDIHTASVWQNIASDFSSSRLPSILESAMEKYDTDQYFLIDKLELDLDAISDGEDLEDRVSVMLKEALRLSSNTPLRDATEMVSFKSEPPFDDVLQEMKFFLEHGFFRWSLVNNVETFRKIFIQFIVKMDTDRFVEWLKNVVTHDNQLLRFLQFFSKDEIKKMVFKVAPYHEVVVTFQNFVTLLLEKIKHVIKTDGVRMNENVIRYKHLLHLQSKGQLPSEEEFIIEWWRDLVRTVAPLSSSSMELIYGTMRSAILPGNEPVSEQDVFVKYVRVILENRVGVETMVDVPLSSAKESRREMLRSDEKVFFVQNAGIVLLYPSLKKLFAKLKLTDETNTFYGIAQRMMACYAIQGMATGKSEIYEYELVLNKVLCGFDLSDPVFVPDETFFGDVSVYATAFVEQMIQGWEKVRNTSVSGFRNSFLLRPGKLVEEDTNWLLTVERKGLDVLLETLPYPISVIKLPWMNKPLFVQW